MSRRRLQIRKKLQALKGKKSREIQKGMGMGMGRWRCRLGVASHINRDRATQWSWSIWMSQLPVISRVLDACHTTHLNAWEASLGREALTTRQMVDVGPWIRVSRCAEGRI